MNEEKNKEVEEAASALLANSEETREAIEEKKKESIEESDGKFFKKYKIKDIVFLAIITACTLITGAIMPLLKCYQ